MPVTRSVFSTQNQGQARKQAGMRLQCEGVVQGMGARTAVSQGLWLPPPNLSPPGGAPNRLTWARRATVHACSSQGVGDSAFVGQNQLFPFSTVVFTSWDFHLTDVDASRNLRSSIRNQLKEMVNDAALDDVVQTCGSRAQSFIRKVC